MTKNELLTSLINEFQNITINHQQFSLFEANFYDWSVCTSFADYEFEELLIELKDLYSPTVVDFYKNNVNQDLRYVEPFTGWNTIPVWYFDEFNNGGIINLKINNFVYYLCAAMYLDLTNQRSFYEWMIRINYPLSAMNEISKILSATQISVINEYLKTCK